MLVDYIFGGIDMEEFKIISGIIGERLRLLRTEKDVSLEEVAKHIELSETKRLSKSLLSRYERGKVDPGVRALVGLAKYYNVSLDWLFGLTEDRKPVNTDNPLLELPDEKKDKAMSYIEFLKDSDNNG